MKSNMVHQFSNVPQVEIPRSKFQRNNRWMGTFDADYLVPIFVDEMVPGDTCTLKENLFGRLNTPIVPIMDNLYLDTFYFFVPNRLLWTNWPKFCGEQDNPGDSTSYLVPQLPAPAAPGGFVANTLADYFGIPVGVNGAAGFNVNSLHFRAYNLIWNEWFRDQNLQDSVVVDQDDGPDSITDYVLKKRGKRYDYFTSSLTSPQKGTAVSIPLGTSARIAHDIVATDDVAVWSTAAAAYKKLDSAATNLRSSPGTTGTAANYLYADLTNATAATINSLRQAFQVQRMLEKDARGGTRYIEKIRSHFGVINPDFRLQRPEYLGGGSSRININPVTQTSSTDATTPQGNLAAFGTVSANNRGFSYSATEHGILIGLASVRADLTYQEGLDRMWSRQTIYDFYWPSLAHLGEQAVLNKEIYLQGTTADDSTFGYQERYGEMRYKNSVVTSGFRSNYATSLDIWHLSQDFSALPSLNSTFIESSTPIDRVVATPDEPHLKLDCFFEANWARPMPMYGVPGFIDRF